MIKRVLFICSLGLLTFTAALAQPWPTLYGQPEHRELSVDIIETYDHGYLICGQYSSPDWQQRWAWLIKADINGEVLWDKIIEGPNIFTTPFSIEQAADGGILVCGITRLEDNTPVPFVLKLNACGEKEWCNVFTGGQNIPSARDIKETANGDIVALINWFGSNPEETLHLFKMNAAGDMIWQQAFASHYNHPQSVENIGSSLLITSENKYLITGTGYWKHPWNPQGVYWIRGFFVMVDSAGYEEWVLPFGLYDTIYSHAFSTIEISNNNFLSVGVNRSSPQLSSLLIFFDSTGTVNNHVTIPNALINAAFEYGDARKIKLVDSLYVIGGNFGLWDLSTNITDFLLDTNLMAGINILGHRQHPDTWSSYNMDITHDQKILGLSSYRHSSTDMDLYAYKLNLNLEFDSAYTGSYTYDSLCIPGPPQSGIVYMDNCDIILGTEIPTAAEYRARIHTIPIAIYPNPAKDKVTFELENTRHHRNIELRCFNLLGMQQYQTTILRGQQQASTNVSNWPPGIYIVVVYSDGMPVGRGKFVVH